MEKETATNKNSISRDQRILVKNSFYSFLNSYGGFIFAVINSFFVARLISQELWGFLILSMSYLSIFFLISGFLPPSIDYSMNRFIPVYRYLNQNTKSKIFIKHALITRLLFLFPIYIINNIIFYLFSDFFKINLLSYYYLLFLLGPLILIEDLQKFLNHVNRSFNYFNIVFIVLVIKYIFNIGILIYFFIFWGNLSLNQLALINIYTALIPFIFNVLITCFILKFKIKKTEESGLSFKENFRNLFKYGFYVSYINALGGIYSNTLIQSIGFFETPEVVLGYNIADHYREISSQAVVSLNQPLTISFSSLYSKEKILEIRKIYDTFFHYTIFLILIVTGVLYFCVDLFLFLIYGKSYLVFSPILKLLLISVIFGVQGIFFNSLLKASENVKFIMPFTTIIILIRITCFLLGLIYFGIIGLLIGIILGNIIGFIFNTIMNYRIFKIKMNITKTLTQYLSFFTSLIIALILEELLLKNLNFLILQNLNLLLFKKFEFLSLISFLIIFFSLNIIFKTYSKSDIEKIESLFNRDNFFHKSVRKGLKILKRFVR